jgi:disulfide bond formation protein DsbB
VDTPVLSPTFATLALACWAALGVGSVAWFATRRRSARGDIERAWQGELRAYALPLAWLVATVATAGSLYYSEVVGFEPCRLCWYQRIAMYPLVPLLGVAALRRDDAVRWYAGPLVAVGAAVAAYHAWLQAFPAEGGSAFCTLTVPCTTRHVWEFGFVSLPFMALTGFVTIGVLLLIARAAPTPTDPDASAAGDPLTDGRPSGGQPDADPHPSDPSDPSPPEPSDSRSALA